MPRKLLKKYLPDPAHLREHKHLRLFGERLADPGLWHMHRRGIANAMAIGIFCAMIPMPFQMLPAAMLSILFRANIPLSIALVWLTNPLTAVPVWYGAYKLGSTMLGMDAAWTLDDGTFEEVWDAILANFWQLYVPILFGSVVIGALLGLAGWTLAHYVWRVHVRSQWRHRAERRKDAARDDPR